MDRVRRGELIVDAVENIFFIAFGMKHDEFRRIQKTPGIQSVHLKEVSPVFPAIAKIEASGGRSKAAVRSSDIACWCRQALARSRRCHDHQAGLPSVFGRRRAGNDLKGLNRIRRQLVRKHLALLVGNRLPIYRKRVRGVIAETVEEPIRVGCYARGSKSYQRAER